MIYLQLPMIINLMLNIIISLALIRVALSQSTISTCAAGQFLYNSICVPQTCVSYLQRIGTTAAGKNGTGTVPINTQGTIQNNDGNVTVSFQFKDVESDGTFQRDNTNSCISSELIRTNIIYEPQGYNETLISSSYDASSGYRNWSFTILPSQYASLAIKSIGTDNTTYTAYFAYRFNVTNITQYTYYFSFVFAINTKTQAASGLAQFVPLNTFATPACSSANNCVSTITTTIGFGSALSVAGCANASKSITIHLGDQLIICVSVTNPNFVSYKITEPKLYIQGSGLLYPATITGTLVTPGLSVFSLQAPFIYSQVSLMVQATAVPANRLLDGSRMLATAGGTPSGGSTLLGCILPVNSTTCPSNVNGLYGPVLAALTIITLLI